jgi:hypothetical protein
MRYVSLLFKKQLFIELLQRRLNAGRTPDADELEDGRLTSFKFDIGGATVGYAAHLIFHDDYILQLLSI